MNINTNNNGENEKNEISGSDSFAAFASLNRFFSLIESGEKPTLLQAEEAVLYLCQMYGAKNEDDLLQRADSELITTFNEMKAKIMADVSLEN